MPARYAPLPNSVSRPDTEREMDDAFADDDDDEHTEATPLTTGYAPTDALAGRRPAPLTIPGAYDFERERDYDYPPPGSPPRPSIFSRPNDIGNSNGQLPSEPMRPAVSASRLGFFRRAVGALLPQHYMRVPTEPAVAAASPVGGGIENDGVFANVMAKPVRGVQVTGADGEVFMVPEDAQKDMPPTYVEAQADAVPPYWETTVHAPGLDMGMDMIVGDLPTGSVLFFLSTMFVSYFFQFVGFLLTYLLHTSHASKHGSRAGLGLTLIHYGFYSRLTREGEGESATWDVQGVMYWNETAGVPMTKPHAQAMEDSPWLMPVNETAYGAGPTDSLNVGFTRKDWIAMLLMTIGWFLLLWSLVSFYRVKRWEASIRASAAPAPPSPITPEQRERDAMVRQNIQRAFGLLTGDDESDGQRVVVQLTEEELLLRQDLEAAGLI